MQRIVHSAHSAEFLCAPIVTSRRYHGHKIIEHMHWHANGSKVNASLCGTEETFACCGAGTSGPCSIRVPRALCTGSDLPMSGHFAQEWLPMCSPHLADHAGRFEDFITQSTFVQGVPRPALRWLVDPDACAKEPRKHECIPGGWRYPRESGPWDQREACTKLAAKGIRSIAFIGDSLARQAMNGLRMVLSGNYQLSEWDWGYKNTSDPRARVCDDAQIKLSYSFGLTEASFLTEADFESNDIVVWGVGRHSTSLSQLSRLGTDRPMVYKAAERNDSLTQLCTPERKAVVASKLIWLDVVPRATRSSKEHTSNGVSPDECVDRVARFHLDMPALLRETCGVTRIASVWNATLAMLMEPRLDLSAGTRDGVHWLPHFNILQAWDILRAVLDTT